MNRIVTAPAIILLAALLAAQLASAGQPPTACDSASQCEGFVKGNNTFAAQLYGELANKAGNLFFSPYSVSSALGMAYAGARGDTAKEMQEVLHFPSDQARLNKTFKRVDKDLMATVNRNGVKLNIANALSLTGGAASKEFETILKDDYDAELFSGGVEQINAWVRQKTEGKIGQILDRLAPHSACVILNAIYFKGLWKSPFSKESTRNAPFNVSSTKRVSAPFMFRRSRFKLLDAKDFQAVSIPYKGDDLSMVILLPGTTEGLAGLEKRMSAARLDQWLKRVDMQPVGEIDLYVPKFTMETSYALKSSFIKMGMKKPFERGADFSGISKGGLWIAQIKHKGFLKVDEKGTEAAAATATQMATMAARPSHPFPVFRADHPFFFLIRDNGTGMILFMGRVDDPTST